MKIENFDELVMEGITLVDFFATWCGPCRMLAPVLEEVEQEVKDIKFIKVDVDENQELANEYIIMSVPTLILFKDGKSIDKKMGFITKEELINWINSKR